MRACGFPNVVRARSRRRISPVLLEAVVCLALNIYHEARGEPREGQVAVAHVVLNRKVHPDFPSTVCSVVVQGGEARHRCQFSWYCDGRSDRPLERTAWERAKAVALSVLIEEDDPTGGAVYYHSLDVQPAWASRFTVTATIGRHIFYRD